MFQAFRFKGHKKVGRISVSRHRLSRRWIPAAHRNGAGKYRCAAAVHRHGPLVPTAFPRPPRRWSFVGVNQPFSVDSAPPARFFRGLERKKRFPTKRDECIAGSQPATQLAVSIIRRAVKIISRRDVISRTIMQRRISRPEYLWEKSALYRW